MGDSPQQGKGKSSKVTTTAHLVNIKNPKEVAKRLKLSFVRTKAKIKIARSQREVDSDIILIDISAAGVGAYITKSIANGSVVEIHITEPKELVAKGIIAWCTPANTLLDSSTARNPFRCGIRFTAQTEEEKNAVESYYSELKKIAKENEVLLAKRRESGENVAAAEADASTSDAIVATAAAPAAPGSAEIKAGAVISAIQDRNESASTEEAAAPADEKKAA